jgi:hypothetical protein
MIATFSKINMKDGWRRDDKKRDRKSNCRFLTKPKICYFFGFSEN